MKNSVELARLCSLDVGKEVTPSEVRSALLSSQADGGQALARFSKEDRQDIMATLLKELASG